MQTYILILRGINVGGKRKIKMTDLKELLSVFELKNCTTYIQSGNVVFQSEAIDTTQLASKIKEQIKESYGFDVPVIIISNSVFQDVFQHNPFLLKEADIDIKQLHVTFLANAPKQKYLDEINALTSSTDEFVIAYPAVYLRCPNGYSKTKLHNAFWEKKLKVTTTTRNWKTVQKLANMASEL